MRLAICLYRLGRGDYYFTIAAMSGVGVSTVAGITEDVCEAIINNLWNDSVVNHFPKNEQAFREKMLDIPRRYELGRLPEVNILYRACAWELSNHLPSSSRGGRHFACLAVVSKTWVFCSVMPGQMFQSTLFSVILIRMFLRFTFFMIVEYNTTQRYENVIKSTPLSVSFNLESPEFPYKKIKQTIWPPWFRCLFARDQSVWEFCRRRILTSDEHLISICNNIKQTLHQVPIKSNN